MPTQLNIAYNFCTLSLTPPNIFQLIPLTATSNFCQLVIQNSLNALEYRDVYMNQVDSFTCIAVQSSVPAYASTRALADRTNATIDQPSKRGKTCPMLELEDALLQLFNVDQTLSIRSFLN